MSTAQLEPKTQPNSEPSEVTQLVQAAIEGDRTAFGELFSRFRGVVLAIAMRRLGNMAEAQELCQDVFLQVIQKIEQLRAAECFPGWITSIAARMAINKAVRRGPVVSVEPEFIEAMQVDERTPLGAALDRERIAMLRAGLNRLRPMDRDTLESFYLRGNSLIEMSRSFQSPLGTIKRRLHVARKRLREEIEEPTTV